MAAARGGGRPLLFFIERGSDLAASAQIGLSGTRVPPACYIIAGVSPISMTSGWWAPASSHAALTGAAVVSMSSSA
ncbi:hypothetical protein [Massilia antarctica]|uniref:hypothetical protein n=1 Tax=Massilia antarctica TaxID=2765360 RepID=UPI00351CDA31